MNEAPVAISDAPVDKNFLLLKVLIAGMTSPFVVYGSRPLSWRSETRRRYQILRTVVGIER